MKFIVAIITALFLFSCYQENNTYSTSDKNLERKIDSLQQQVQLLKKELEKPSASVKDSVKNIISKPQTEKTTPSKPKKKTTNPTVILIPKDDTTFHKYKNGKISVKIFPWRDSKRKIILYNPKGEKTYEFEDIRLSYSNHTTLKFRNDGSVESSNTHMNPGASMYWYETDITFDNYNTPLVKKETEMPMTRLDRMQLPYFWNKEKNQWVQQEIIKETNSLPSK